jgi:hypothetical protein
VIRAELRALPTAARVDHAARVQPEPTPSDPIPATRLAMRELACRHQALTAEIGRLETALVRLTATTAPRLLAVFGAGPDVAGRITRSTGDPRATPLDVSRSRTRCPTLPEGHMVAAGATKLSVHLYRSRAAG